MILVFEANKNNNYNPFTHFFVNFSLLSTVVVECLMGMMMSLSHAKIRLMTTVNGVVHEGGQEISFVHHVLKSRRMHIKFSALLLDGWANMTGLWGL